MPRYTPKDLKPIIDELIGNNDRAKAVVGGAIIDSSLDYAISARIKELPEPDENGLFSYTGPFGGCDQKIQAGYALGLFGPKTKKDMERINAIRNYCAHNMNPISFDDDKLSENCRQMFTATNSDCHDGKLWREKFVLAVQIIMDGLIMEANEAAPRVAATPKYLSD
jgi:hypothetical protein